MDDLSHLNAALNHLAAAIEHLVQAQVTPAEAPAPPAIDRRSYDLLRSAGVREPHLSTLAAACTPTMIADWLDYIDHSGLSAEHRAGYLIRRLQAGQPAPADEAYHALRRRYAPRGQEGILQH